MPERGAMLESFCRLVKIDSLSGRETQVAKYLAGCLEALGFAVEFDTANVPINGEVGNVIAKLPATAPGLPTLMLQSHMDTVTPGEGIVPQVGEEYVTSAGNTILGADAKAGVNVILHAVTEVIEQNIPHCKIFRLQPGQSGLYFRV